MNLVRTGSCPNCGAPIEFALGSCVSKVCTFCSHVVVRTDRDLATLGKIAELVPTNPPFEVGDVLTIEGRGARVTGRVQKEWGAGPWDELSVEFDDGAWAWLARAQGRWYVTSRVDQPGGPLPPFAAVRTAGQRGRLGAHPAEWTVTEAREARVLAARGDFPEPFAAGEVSAYVDLVAPGGAFATLDYASPDAAPALYIGKVLPASAIVLASAALGPRPAEKTRTAALRCPNCGAPLELRDPGHVERVACGACGAIHEPRAEGANLALVHVGASPPFAAHGWRRTLTIPLGTKGTLRGTGVLVIGAMKRCTIIDGARYEWLEYLLHTDAGYLWLLEDNGHFTLIRDADVTKANFDAFGSARYEGQKFKAFFSNPVRVLSVVGEFYWKVSEGETTYVDDFVAPPRVLSRERTDQEANFSIGEYLEPAEVAAAFGGLALPSRIGVAPAQPGPGMRGPALALGLGLLLLVCIACLVGGRSRALATFPLAVLNGVGTDLPRALDNLVPFGKPTPTPAPSADELPNVTIAPSFVVAKTTSLGFTLAVPQDNLYVAADCALVNEQTGDTREFGADVGYYEGVAGGERWTEGSHSETVYLDRIPPGTYTVHVRTTWEAFTGDGAYPVLGAYGIAPPTPSITVLENARSPFCFLLSFALIFLPAAFAFLRARNFERQRWENSNLHSDEG
jgi:ribosomal protein S27AE